MKKCFSLLIALAMVFTMAPLGVFAEDPIEAVSEPGYLVYEPKDMTLLGGSVSIKTDKPGLNGYVSDVGPNDGVQIVVNAGKAGQMNVKLKTLAPDAWASTNVIITNNTNSEVAQKPLGAEGAIDWNTWGEVTLPVTVAQGDNELEIHADTQVFMLDYVAVELEPGYTVYQPGDMTMLGGAGIASQDGKQYSGEGYVNYIGGGNGAKISINAAAAGEAKLRLRVGTPSGHADKDITITNTTAGQTVTTQLGAAAVDWGVFKYFETAVPVVAGDNEIEFRASFDGYLLDYVAVDIPEASGEELEPGFTVIQENDSAVTSYGAGANFLPNEGGDGGGVGYTGGGFYSAIGSGRGLFLKYTADTAGEKTVRIRYANPYPDKTLWVHNTATGQCEAIALEVPGEVNTGNWAVSEVKLVLEAGVNGIEFFSDAPGVSVDYFAVSDATDTTKEPQWQVYEAENMTDSDNNYDIQTSVPTYTGTGAVQGYGVLSFPVTSDVAGTRKIRVRYCLVQNMDTRLKVVVKAGGTQISETICTAAGSWGWIPGLTDAAEITLAQGENTIEISKVNDATPTPWFIDFLSMEKTTTPSEVVSEFTVIQPEDMEKNAPEDERPGVTNGTSVIVGGGRYASAKYNSDKAGTRTVKVRLATNSGPWCNDPNQNYDLLQITNATTGEVENIDLAQYKKDGVDNADDWCEATFEMAFAQGENLLDMETTWAEVHVDELYVSKAVDEAKTPEKQVVLAENMDRSQMQDPNLTTFAFATVGAGATQGFGAASFKVTSDVAGTRKMRLRFCNFKNDPSKLLITSSAGTSQEVSTSYLCAVVGVWFVTEDIEVQLAAGENTITIAQSGSTTAPQAVNWVAIDKETTPSEVPSEEWHVIQPEDMNTNATIEAEKPGITNGKYLNAVGGGRWASAKYTSDKAGTRTVKVRIATYGDPWASTDNLFQITNATTGEVENIDPSQYRQGWGDNAADWFEVAFPMAFAQGENLLDFETTWNGVCIDDVSISKTVDETKLPEKQVVLAQDMDRSQMEDTGLTGGVANYVGTGAMQGFGTASFTVESAVAGTRKMRLRFAHMKDTPSKLLITSTGGTSQEVSTTYVNANVGVWFVTEDFEVKLAQGTNTITIGKSGEQNVPQAVNWVAIDKETTPGQPVEEEFDIYQPNDASATIYGGGTVNSDETNGCTGGVFYDAIGSGRGISYNYNAAETGQRTVRIRYACAYGNVSFWVSNLATGETHKIAAETSGWGGVGNWRIAEFPMGFLQGENKIDIIGNMPGAHFDYLSVSKTANTAVSAPSVTFQAENMEITAPAAASTEHTGYTGDGFVAMSTGGIKFTINSNEAGTRKLWLRYAYGLTDGPSQITVTSSAGTTQKISITNECGGGFWDYWYISEPVTVKLAAGENTIEIKALDGDKGSFNVDYVALDSATAAFDGLTVTNVKVDGKTEANITSYTQSMALTYTANQEVNQILYAFGPDDETADSFDDWTGAAQAAGNALTELPKTAGTYRLHLKFVSGDQEVVDHSIRVTVTESENPEPGFAVIQPSAMTPLGVGGNISNIEGCTGGEAFSAIGSGRSISAIFNSDAEGERTVHIRYALEGGDGVSPVEVLNLTTGEKTTFLPYESTVGTDWKVAEVKLAFAAGQNQIELVFGGGGVAIDYVAISDAVDTNKTVAWEVKQAEAMDVSNMDGGSGCIQSGTAGYTGSGFIQGFGTARFTINSEKKGVRTLRLRFLNGKTEPTSLRVTSSAGTNKVVRTDESTFWIWYTEEVEVKLNEGVNTIEIKNSGESCPWHLDFVAFEKETRVYTGPLEVANVGVNGSANATVYTGAQAALTYEENKDLTKILYAFTPASETTFSDWDSAAAAENNSITMPEHTDDYRLHVKFFSGDEFVENHDVLVSYKVLEPGFRVFQPNEMTLLEGAYVAGPTSPEAAQKGCTGPGILNNLNKTNGAQLTYNSDSARTATVRIRTATAGPWADKNIIITNHTNNTVVTKAMGPEAAIDWNVWGMFECEIQLAAGENNLEFHSDSDGVQVDYIAISTGDMLYRANVANEKVYKNDFTGQGSAEDAFKAKVQVQKYLAGGTIAVSLEVNQNSYEVSFKASNDAVGGTEGYTVAEGKNIDMDSSMKYLHAKVSDGTKTEYYTIEIELVENYADFGLKSISIAGVDASIEELGQSANINLSISSEVSLDNAKIVFAGKKTDGTYKLEINGTAVNNNGTATVKNGDTIKVLASWNGHEIETVYTLRVIANNEKPKMTSFAVKEHPGYEAEIDNKDNTITMKLPSGAKLGSLTAIFAVSDGATVTVDGVEQVSGQTKNDFSQTVTYTLKGKNGATSEYKVTINVRSDGGDPVKPGGDETGSNIKPNNKPGTSFPEPGYTPSGSFSDVTSAYDWAKEAISSLAKKGVINGYEDGTFRPQNSVTREEFLKMVLGAFGISVSGGGQTPFGDVNAQSWYAPYIAKAVELGICKGISETEFGVGQTITREQMAVFVYRTLAACGKTVTGQGTAFADQDSISAYAQEAVLALSGAGVINGMGDGTFAPQQQATRAQAAVMIYQAIQAAKEV